MEQSTQELQLEKMIENVYVVMMSYNVMHMYTLDNLYIILHCNEISKQMNLNEFERARISVFATSV